MFSSDSNSHSYLHHRLVCLVAVYIAGGVAYNLIAKKASGVEALPNAGFWREFFGCFIVTFLLSSSCAFVAHDFCI